MNEFTEIFRHQQPFVADMVFNALREAKIPCYKQEGAITGLLQAFPVFPVAYPGIEFIIFVFITGNRGANNFNNICLVN